MSGYDLAKKGMTFARFFPSDWRTGCLTLDLEEEGLYIRICMFMYDTASALPADNRKSAMLLRVHPLKFEKVLERLIAKGKIIRAQGYLINERVIEEFERWQNETAARQQAAKRREDARKQATTQAQIEQALKASKTPTPQTTPTLTPHLTPQTTPPVVGGVTGVDTHPVGFKKANENNATGAQPDQSSSTNQKLEARNQKPEEERKEIRGGTERGDRKPPHEDFGFDGERISFDHDEVAAYRLDFPELEFPRDLRIVEKATHYRVGHSASRAEFMEQLRHALDQKAMDFRALKEKVHQVAEAKAEGQASTSCYIRNGRIFVANGFEAEILEEFASGDKQVLREALDKAGQYVPAKARGETLMLAVRTQLTKQKQWAETDTKGKKNSAPDAVSNMMNLARERLANTGGRA